MLETSAAEEPEIEVIHESVAKTGADDRTEAESLLRRFKSNPDPRTRERLVNLHINLVRFLAAKFVSRGEPIEDLIQVGTIGLINAIDRFDPEREIKFSTFATPTIVGEIRRYFRDKAWSLKVPRRMQELNLLTSKVRENLTNELGRPPTIMEVAKAANISEEEVLQALEVGSAYDTISLETHVIQDSESSSGSLADIMGAYDPALENVDSEANMSQAMACLDQRERSIIHARYFKEMSQADVAKMLNISQMHVSRIQKQALRKLRTAFAPEV